MTPPTTYPYPCAVYAVWRCLGRPESGQIYQFMALHLVAVDGVACAGYAIKFALNVLSRVKKYLSMRN